MQYAVIEGISFGILDGIKSILKVNENFEKIYVVGGGSKSSFWIQFLSSLLNRELRVCDQSEFGAALGVARLAIFADKKTGNKDEIIKKIKVSKEFYPQSDNIEILLKRYEVWKNIYSSNKIIASDLFPE